MSGSGVGGRPDATLPITIQQVSGQLEDTRILLVLVAKIRNVFEFQRSLNGVVMVKNIGRGKSFPPPASFTRQYLPQMHLQGLFFSNRALPVGDPVVSALRHGALYLP